MLQNYNVKEFVDKTASKSPVPGGGSIAAFVASLGGALSSMVFNISMGKKAYNELSEDKQRLIQAALNDSIALTEMFLEIMEEDALSFGSWMEAFKLPKDTEEEIEIRKAKIKEASENSLSIPRKLLGEAVKVYSIIDIAIEYGSINIISDAGVAASLIHAAVESSAINIRINLGSIKEEELKRKISLESERAVEDSLKLKLELMKKLYTKI